MILTIPSLYQFKKAVLYPRKLYMRHKEKFEPGFLQKAMELHYYRPAFYRWCGAVGANPHLLYQANISADSVVIDAGAYIGEWAQDIAARYNATVHAYEPDPRNFKLLKERSQHSSQIIAHEFGVGERGESIRMALEFLGSSMFSKNNTVPTAQVEIRDIVDVWQSLGRERIALMKINIEGAEFPLLERMIETNLLEKVDCYLIQFHEWHPGAYRRRRRIRKALSNTHQLEWDYHFVWEKWVKRMKND
ncbi:MAG: FkbM family methyltransferase [Halioglobus sp.]|nr:FkbM family methyltransferase [Halioglobus sp.]